MNFAYIIIDTFGIIVIGLVIALGIVMVKKEVEDSQE